jgi:hypothetical protein
MINFNPAERDLADLSLTSLNPQAAGSAVAGAASTGQDSADIASTTGTTPKNQTNIKPTAKNTAASSGFENIGVVPGVEPGSATLGQPDMNLNALNQQSAAAAPTPPMAAQQAGSTAPNGQQAAAGGYLDTTNQANAAQYGEWEQWDTADTTPAPGGTLGANSVLRMLPTYGKANLQAMVQNGYFGAISPSAYQRLFDQPMPADYQQVPYNASYVNGMTSAPDPAQGGRNLYEAPQNAGDPATIGGEATNPPAGFADTPPGYSGVGPGQAAEQQAAAASAGQQAAAASGQRGAAAGQQGGGQQSGGSYQDNFTQSQIANRGFTPEQVEWASQEYDRMVAEGNDPANWAGGSNGWNRNNWILNYRDPGQVTQQMGGAPRDPGFEVPPADGVGQGTAGQRGGNTAGAGSAGNAGNAGQAGSAASASNPATATTGGAGPVSQFADDRTETAIDPNNPQTASLVDSVLDGSGNFSTMADWQKERVLNGLQDRLANGEADWNLLSGNPVLREEYIARFGDPMQGSVGAADNTRNEDGSVQGQWEGEKGGAFQGEASTAAAQSDMTVEDATASTAANNDRTASIDEMSSDQLREILQSDSPLMQLAAQDGVERANAAGLRNSSLAAGASMAEMTRQASPLAMQQADVENRTGMQNQALESSRLDSNANRETQTSQFNAGQENQATSQEFATEADRRKFNAATETDVSVANAGMANETQMQDRDIASRYNLQQLAGDQDYAKQELAAKVSLDLADIEGSYNLLISDNAAAASILQASYGAIADVIGNAEIFGDEAVEKVQFLVQNTRDVLDGLLAFDDFGAPLPVATGTGENSRFETPDWNSDSTTQIGEGQMVFGTEGPNGEPPGSGYYDESGAWQNFTTNAP